MKLKSIEKYLKYISTFVGIVIFLTIGSYFYWFQVKHDQDVSISVSDWGALGDFLGGILNPVVAFSAFLVLILSVRLQKTEFANLRSIQEESHVNQLYQASLSEEQLKQTIIDSHKQTLLRLIEQQINAQQKELDGIRSARNMKKNEIKGFSTPMPGRPGERLFLDGVPEEAQRSVEKLQKEMSKIETMISLLNEFSINVAVSHYDSRNELSDEFKKQFEEIMSKSNEPENTKGN